MLKLVKGRKYMIVYPYGIIIIITIIIIKNSDVSKVRKLNVDAVLVGCFLVVEYVSWKFIVTSLSTSRRPLKERIWFHVGKLFLYATSPLGRIGHLQGPRGKAWYSIAFHAKAMLSLQRPKLEWCDGLRRVSNQDRLISSRFIILTFPHHANIIKK